MKKGVVILGVVFLFLLVFNSFFVSATIFDDVKDFFTSSYDNWVVGTMDANVARFFILVIITLLVFVLLETTGFFGDEENPKSGILWTISIAVGLLSSYMSPLVLPQIQNIYTAFGGALITILPFLILGGLTMRAVKDGNVQLMIIQHVAWGIFAVFLIYVSFFVSKTPSFFSKGNIILGSTAILSMGLFFLNSKLLGWLSQDVLKAKAVASANSAYDISQGIELFRNTGRRTSR